MGDLSAKEQICKISFEKFKWGDLWDRFYSFSSCILCASYSDLTEIFTSKQIEIFPCEPHGGDVNRLQRRAVLVITECPNIT